MCSIQDNSFKDDDDKYEMVNKLKEQIKHNDNNEINKLWLKLSSKMDLDILSHTQFYGNYF